MLRIGCFKALVEQTFAGSAMAVALKNDAWGLAHLMG